LYIIRKEVAFSKKPANADPIKYRTPITPMALKLPPVHPLSIDIGNSEVLGRSKLNYSIIAVWRDRLVN
jgi:hypothetical protein